ncbi:hypothetical protein CCP3SC5AM1_1330003 [Gammaproteobacteria bacterium]
MPYKNNFELLILFWSILGMGIIFPATAVVITHGEFVASDQCTAPVTFQEAAVNEIQLEPGRAYRTLALERRKGGLVRIIIPEARPRVRWAKLSCGEYRADEGTLHFSPFFDQHDNLVYVDYPRKIRQDITPPPPPVNPLEERLLALCGYPGDYPEPGAFRSLIDSSPQLLTDLSAALFCHNNQADCEREMILDRLTDLWFLADGFRRVFCGEPNSKRMDGPHYRAAYLQLQRRGWGGLMAPHKGREEIIPRLIYSIGIEHEWHGQRVQTPVSPGYFYTLDGASLLIHGTRGITLLGAPDTKQACRYTFKVANESKNTNKILFNSVVIGKDGGLKTFYPTVLADRTLRPCEE